MAGALTRLIVAAAILTGMAACGGAGSDTAGKATPAAPWVDPDGEDPVVGALAPDGDKLWLATNRGLFRVAGGRAERVRGALRTARGNGTVSSQLVVSVTRDGSLLASGHPDSDTLPPVLGLIRSEDDGRTWTPVSELGSADFHVIEEAGDRLIAGQFGEAGVLVSADAGSTWRTRAAPGVLVDLAVNGDDPDEWAATTSDTLYTSDDEGKTWRAQGPYANARLAWPAGDRLVRADPGGEISISADSGRSWRELGDAGDEVQVLTATGDGLWVATLDGSVVRSPDGRAWTSVLAPRT